MAGSPMVSIPIRLEADHLTGAIDLMIKHLTALRDDLVAYAAGDDPRMLDDLEYRTGAAPRFVCTRHGWASNFTPCPRAGHAPAGTQRL